MIPGLMSAPARDHPGYAGMRPTSRPSGSPAGMQTKDTGGIRIFPTGIPAARTQHRDRDQLHRQG
jgi:hypothetical protein